MCTTGIKGTHHLLWKQVRLLGLRCVPLWLLGLKVYAIVTTGIKSVCYYNLVSKADQWDYFTLRSSSSLYLLKHNWNAIILHPFLHPPIHLSIHPSLTSFFPFVNLLWQLLVMECVTFSYLPITCFDYAHLICFFLSLPNLYVLSLSHPPHTTTILVLLVQPSSFNTIISSFWYIHDTISFFSIMYIPFVLVYSLLCCCSQCSIAVKTHHDHNNSYKEKL